MKIPIYQIDAFAAEVFRGNPAAVCPLEEWLDTEGWIQSIGAENNLSETAFILRRDEEWDLRWFTPVMEVSPLRPRDAGIRLRRLPVSETRDEGCHIQFPERPSIRHPRKRLAVSGLPGPGPGSLLCVGNSGGGAGHASSRSALLPRLPGNLRCGG